MADNARIDTLVSTLLAHGDRHDQDVWRGGCTISEFREPSCQSSGCAGGWAEVLFGTEEGYEAHRQAAFGGEYARELLGLTSAQAQFVFYGTLGCEDPEWAAVGALKHLKDHPGATWHELEDEFPAAEPEEEPEES